MRNLIKMVLKNQSCWSYEITGRKGSKSNRVVLIKSLKGNASAFPFSDLMRTTRFDLEPMFLSHSLSPI